MNTIALDVLFVFSLFFCKCLLLTINISDYWNVIEYIPCLFIAELFILYFWILFRLTMASSMARLCVNSVALIMLCMDLVYFLKTGHSLNAATSLDAIRHIDSTWHFFVAQTHLLILILVGFLICLLLLRHFLSSLAAKKPFDKLHLRPSILVFIFLYFAIFYPLRPPVVKDSLLCSNVLLDFPIGFIQIMISAIFIPSSPQNGNINWMDMCPTASLAIKQFYSKEQVCFPHRSNFDIKNDLGIKNIIMIGIESARSDIFPLNPQSSFAQKITPEFRKIETFAPFIESLKSKSIFSTNAKSTSSYTIKSLLSTFCSMYPYPENFSVEQNYQYYAECLPILLKRHGYKSSFFQASDAQFDHQEDVFKKIGFDFMFDRHNIDNGELGFIPSTVNYFGYDDKYLIDPIMKWINSTGGSPFLLSLLTNVSHDPYTTPSDWPIQRLTGNFYSNKYLNSIRYIDHFLSNIMEEFAKKGLLESSIIVIFGDHGISLWDHGLFGTAENSHENLYNIPIFFYSESKEWLKLVKSHSNRNSTWTNLDILPSLLDILSGSNGSLQSYEGQSILGEKEERIIISSANPGMHSICLREGNLKLIIPGTSAKPPQIFDIARDPEEFSPISVEGHLEFYHKMMYIFEVWKSSVIRLYNRNVTASQ